MRFKIFILSLIISVVSCKSNIIEDKNTFAENIVVAHRGAWKEQGLPQNSIAALKHSIAMNCTGTEFDVRMTSDEILIVTHDEHYHSLVIEATPYDQLARFKLDNGETLPTLKEFILAGINDNTTTGLVCEIKPASSKERGELMAQKVLSLVKELKAEKFVSSYISFDVDILKKIIEIDSSAHTQYLDGSLSPSELTAYGISGLDYHMNAFKNKPEWITQAKDLGLSLNVWTVNKQEDIDFFLAHNFDYITTNEPELLFQRISASPTANGYELVWSDEFDYTGLPDSSKWNYDYGYIANQEAQYYTDHTKNARVEEGTLIIEAHKEKISKEQFKAYKNESKAKQYNNAGSDTAQYTSARLLTHDRAAWQYGYIEVKAKLPKGRGIWPAIWMLGENQKEVGWPACGEIDIMEHVGYEPDTIYGTIHSETYNHMKGTQKMKTIFIDDPYNEYHLYALKWTSEQIEFLMDGVVFNRIVNQQKTAAEWPFNQKFHLLLNVAVGGMWGGRKGIDDSIFPQRMTIDYVRIFQREEHQ